MKITVSPADIRACNECLSAIAGARQWGGILQAAGIDVTDEFDRLAANERIATGILQAAERLRDTVE